MENENGGRRSEIAAGKQRSASTLKSSNRELSLSASIVWEALRSPLRLQMLEAIGSSGGTDARRLAEALGSSPPRLYYHLRILVDAGLVRAVDEPGRRAGRGPAAVTYEPALPELPLEFFTRDGVARERSAKLLHAVAAAGLEAVVPTNGHARGVADFRHESLTESELIDIQRHVEGIRHILNQARGRRRKRAALEVATAFVGVCVAPLSEQTLPDHPIQTGGGNGRA